MAGHAELDDFPPMAPIISAAEYKARQTEIEINRAAAANAMRHAIWILKKQGAVKDATCHVGYYVQGILTRIENHTKVVHIELNPNSQRRRVGLVTLTEQDSDELQRVRDSGLVSTGAEGTAITRHILPDEVHLGQANDYPLLLTGNAVAAFLEQVLFSDPQLNKARGFARIIKLFSR